MSFLFSPKIHFTDLDLCRSFVWKADDAMSEDSEWEKEKRRFRFCIFLRSKVEKLETLVNLFCETKIKKTVFAFFHPDDERNRFFISPAGSGSPLLVLPMNVYCMQRENVFSIGANLSHLRYFQRR